MSPSRRVAGLLLFGSVTAAGASFAQSSQFSARGFGIPLRTLSVRATATGGSFGWFDPESALNPAAVGLPGGLVASFQTVQSWRNSESPAGSGSARDHRYPGLYIGGPIGGTELRLAVSVSGYTDRNFSLASQDTLTIRGIPLTVYDTLSSQGGISDLRVAVGWTRSRRLQLGLGVHLLTGSNRIVSHRTFSDTAFSGASERNTVSYLGFGVSAGVLAQLASGVTVAGMVRADEKMRVERDSTSIGKVKLPFTLSIGVRLDVTPRLQAATGALWRNWSVADADLVAQNGIGSVNTGELSAGLEYRTNPRRPFHRPIRLGVYHTQLPFSLRRGENASETGITLGSSQRFVGDRAGLDAALARVWRNGAPGFSETAWLLTLGVAIRL